MSTRNKFPLKKFRLLCIPAALSVLAGLPIAGQAQTLSTVAGSGVQGAGMSPVASAQAQFSGVTSILRTPYGGFFATEFNTSRIRWIGDDGTTTIAAGNGAGFVDNVPLSQAKFNGPNAIIMAPDGSIVIFDATNNRIRRMSGNDQMVTTIIGNGNAGSGGDGGPANEASLNFPTGGVYGPNGELYVVEGNGHRIRRIDADGITTIAGTGVAGSSGDNGPANEAQLNSPRAIAISPDGNVLYVTEQNRIRAINLANGNIYGFAGNGQAGAGGDGGNSWDAQLGGAWTAANGRLQQVGALAGIAVLSDGRVLVTDRANNKIRQISADYKISTYAGNGQAGYTANGSFNGANGYYGGGALAQTAFRQPAALATDGDDNVYFSDFFNFAVRKFEAPPSQFDSAQADGVKWNRSVFPVTKAKGCELVDMAEGANGGLRLTFVGPTATCTAPPQWAGTIVATDLGPDELPGFALRVSSLVSQNAANGQNTFVVDGVFASLAQMMRSGSLSFGDELTAAIETSMEKYANSPEAVLKQIEPRVVIADGGASPYNTFTRALVSAIPLQDRNKPWAMIDQGSVAGNVAGTKLPSSAFAFGRVAQTADQQPVSGQLAASVSSISRELDASLTGRSVFNDALMRSSSSDDLIAFNGINLGFADPIERNVRFFYNKTDGGGFELKDFNIGLSTLGLTSFNNSHTEEEKAESKAIAAQGLGPKPGTMFEKGDYSYGIISGGINIKEGRFTHRTYAISQVLGIGPAPANKTDCWRATVPRYAFGVPGVLRGNDVHACSTEKVGNYTRWIGSVTAKGVFGYEFELAVEKQWAALAGPIPVFGTWTMGVWVGATASGGVKMGYGFQRANQYTTKLSQSGFSSVSDLDTQVKAAGPTATFQATPNLKVAFYAQPFAMVSFSKIKGYGDLKNKAFPLPGGKPIVFINNFWTQLISNSDAVVKNGILRINANAKVETGFNFDAGKQKPNLTTVEMESCFSVGARADFLKGLIPGTQLQLSGALGPWCMNKYTLSSTGVVAEKLADGSLAYNFNFVVKEHP